MQHPDARHLEHVKLRLHDVMALTVRGGASCVQRVFSVCGVRAGGGQRPVRRVAL